MLRAGTAECGAVQGLRGRWSGCSQSAESQVGALANPGRAAPHLIAPDCQPHVAHAAPDVRPGRCSVQRQTQLPWACNGPLAGLWRGLSTREYDSTPPLQPAPPWGAPRFFEVRHASRCAPAIWAGRWHPACTAACPPPPPCLAVPAHTEMAMPSLSPTMTQARGQHMPGWAGRQATQRASRSSARRAGTHPTPSHARTATPLQGNIVAWVKKEGDQIAPGEPQAAATPGGAASWQAARWRGGASQAAHSPAVRSAAPPPPLTPPAQATSWRRWKRTRPPSSGRRRRRGTSLRSWRQRVGGRGSRQPAAGRGAHLSGGHRPPLHRFLNGRLLLGACHAGSKDIPVGTPVAVLVEESGDVGAFASYSPGAGGEGCGRPAGAGDRTGMHRDTWTRGQAGDGSSRGMPAPSPPPASTPPPWPWRSLHPLSPHHHHPPPAPPCPPLPRSSQRGASGGGGGASGGTQALARQRRLLPRARADGHARAEPHHDAGQHQRLGEEGRRQHRAR